MLGALFTTLMLGALLRVAPVLIVKTWSGGWMGDLISDLPEGLIS